MACQPGRRGPRAAPCVCSGCRRAACVMFMLAACSTTHRVGRSISSSTSTLPFTAKGACARHAHPTAHASPRVLLRTDRRHCTARGWTRYRGPARGRGAMMGPPTGAGVHSAAAAPAPFGSAGQARAQERHACCTRTALCKGLARGAVCASALQQSVTRPCRHKGSSTCLRSESLVGTACCALRPTPAGCHVNTQPAKGRLPAGQSVSRGGTGAAARPAAAPSASTRTPLPLPLPAAPPAPARGGAAGAASAQRAGWQAPQPPPAPG